MIDEIVKLRELTETLTGHGYLRDKAEEWEYVLDSLPDAIYIVNTEYKLKFINRVLAQKLNLADREEVYDTVCYEAIEGVPNPVENPPDAKGPSTLPDVFIKGLGGWYSVSRSPIMTDTNKLIGFIVILKDVTDKREAELSAAARQNMLETIYKASPIGIGISKHVEDRVIVFVNRAVADMLETTENQIVGQSARILYPSDEEYERVGQARIDKDGGIKKVTTLEVQLKTFKGSIIDVFLSSSRIPDSDESVFTIMDITTVKENENILKRNEERLEALLELSKLTYLDEETLQTYALEEMVRLTDSEIGYLHYVRGESNEGVGIAAVDLHLFAWSKKVHEHCHADKTEHYPLEHAGIWADSVRTREPVIHNDYLTEKTKKGLPEGHIPLKRHMSVPVFDGKFVVAVAGVGNKKLPYSQTDAYQMSIFMKSMWEILRRRQAERFAAQSRESLERLINTSPMGVFVYKLVDDHLILTHLNMAAQTILNMTAEPYIGKNLEDIFVGLGETEVPRMYRKIARDGGVYNKASFAYKDENLNIDGVFNVFAFQSSSDEVSIFFSDVTEQARIQKTIEKSEVRFRTAFMTIPDPALILEYGAGNIVAVNPATCRVSGYEEKELVGKNILDINLWDSIYDREEFYGILAEQGSVENFPVKVRLRDGALRDAALTSRVFELDGRLHVMSILKDMSALVALRESVCQTDSMYKAILDKIQDGVFLIQDRKMVLANKPLCNLLGYEPEDLVGRDVEVILSERSAEFVLETYEKRMAGEPVLNIYNAFLVSRDGKEVEVTIDVNLVTYGGKKGSMGTINLVNKDEKDSSP